LEETNVFGRSENVDCGNGIQEVVGSIPIGSTNILNGLQLTDRPEASQL